MNTFFKLPARAVLVAALIIPMIDAALPADAAGWQLDLQKSKLGFSGMQTGTKFEGAFSRYHAEIAFDPDHLEISHITVTIDLASAATGDTQRDTALPGKDWFNVSQFPQAKFETINIRKKDANVYEAVGNLTLHGVTKQFVLPFTLEINGPTAHAKGHAELVRSAFGIGQGQWATEQWIALEVGVDIDIVATRAN
jgi:polyisoprenoid-binding protein YceI